MPNAVKQIQNMFRGQKSTPIGKPGFDNARDVIDDNPRIKGLTVKELRIGSGSVSWTTDGTDLFLKNAGTTLLTINLTTGNMTLGGTQKRVICTKVVGA